MANEGHGHVRPRDDGMKARCGGPGICPQCSQEAVTAEFADINAATVPAPPVQATARCPNCGTAFDPTGPVRVTEG
jgi:ribosomal protein S27AE